MERLERVWRGMISRCENPKGAGYEYYGGRGIKVCEEWHEYNVFKEWALKNGYDKDAPRGKTTIDRIDVNGNYEPSNCRFANTKEQARNKTITRYVEIEGVAKPIPVWAEESNIPQQIIYHRYYNKGIRGKDLLKPCKVTVGENIINFRTLRGDKNIHEVAHGSGVSYYVVSRIDCGEYLPGQSVSRKLAAYFNLPVETFTCTFEEGE